MKEHIALPMSPLVAFAALSNPLEKLSPPLPEYELGVGIEMRKGLEANYAPEPLSPPADWPVLAEGVELQKRLLELEAMVEELRAEGQLKANFISAVVHDIRSPLTVMLGVLDMMNEDLAAARPLEESYYQPLLKDALRSCQEVAELLNDMLDLSKMTRQRLLTSDFTKMSVMEVVESVMQVAGGAARQADVKLSCKIQANLPHVYLDRKQMHRALMNLVTNAIKFTPPHGSVTIRASFLNEKRRDAMCDYVLLSVIDTGEGLAPTESPYVFDAYWQAQNGKRKTGSGLGLAIVKRIAVAHGGNVSVRSQLGKGSTFTIMIPVLDEPPTIASEDKH
ncbi:MAG TPA: HAMP domain-containing sensor histidine kinase [Blastocatellia bacterium]|nr:HAMP domain-containing sensor histidine kinase [Blastocatellia bacterium]